MIIYENLFILWSLIELYEMVVNIFIKFVNCSIVYMLQKFHEEGIKSNQIEAYLYGGSNIMKIGDENSIGNRNIEIARKMLSHFGLTILHENVGGSRGRSINFDTESGDIKMTFQEGKLTGNIKNKK